MKLSVSYKQTDVGDAYDAILIGSGIEPRICCRLGTGR